MQVVFEAKKLTTSFGNKYEVIGLDDIQFEVNPCPGMFL